MKRILAALAAVVLIAGPATAATYPIIGKVGETYTKAGGAPTFGEPRSAEVKSTVSSTNGYGQPFTKGYVFWSRIGAQTFVYPKGPNLAKVSNERDALAASGFRPGVLYRTAKLCDANTLDKLVVSSVLKGGTILDLRTGSVCKEPTFPGVKNVRTSIPSHADYARYVTGSTERKAFTAALRVLANNPGPILLHCTAGKDRTGWTVSILLHVLGASDATVKAEYFRTKDGSTSRWNAGNAAVAKVGGWNKYIAQLLTPAEIQQLRNRYL
jgi:hypothetical protein